MYNQQNSHVNSGSSNTQFSQEIIANAISQLSQLTGLNERDSLDLISDSVKEKLPAPRMRGYINENLINQKETDFISSIFE